MGETMTVEKDKGGRPSKAYDPEFIRDISVQVLIEFYNERQTALRDRMSKINNFVDRLRLLAAPVDVEVLAWLTALDYVPKSHKRWKNEVTFRAWCLRLEPPMPPKKLDSMKLDPKTGMSEREAYLRGVIEKHITDEHWRLNCKRYVDAIERVRTDKCLTLKLPPPLPEEEDEEDEYL